MSGKLIDLEVQLLLAKYGREAIVSALAQASECSHEQIAQEIRDYASAKKKSPARRRKVKSTVAADKIVSERPELRVMADLYEGKQFLPTLRDAQSFLREHGRKDQVKSRAAALAKVLGVLAEFPPARIDEMKERVGSSRDPSVFEALAKELMQSDTRADE